MAAGFFHFWICHLTTAASIPAPLPGEIQVDYFDRVFPLLSGTTEERNDAILSAWDASEESSRLEGVAAKKLPTDRYSRFQRVPVFEEHAAQRVSRDANGKPVRDKDGNPVMEDFTWDRNRLAAMCYQMNHRILDSGSFSPIIEGHTSDQPGAAQPAVLGYQGKFRIGKIGNINPRYAIFADEYHANEHREKFKTLTRRSPEVWVNAPKPFFDPVAALGANTPRLDMGISIPYSRGNHWTVVGDDGAEVEKYSMADGTLPAANNVAQQLPVQADRPDQYEAGEHDDGIVNAVIDAIQQIPAFQMLQQIAPILPALQKLALQSELPEPEESSEPPAAEQPTAPAPTPAPEQPQTAPEPVAESPPPAPAPASPAPADDPDKNMMTRYMAGEINEPEMRAYRDSKKQPAAPVAPQSPQVASQYQLRAEIADLEARKAKLLKDTEEANATAMKAARYSRLETLRAQGYEFEMADEYAHCLDLNDQQFERHCNLVVTKYGRTPIGGPSLPVMSGDPGQKKPLRSDSREHDEIIKYAKYQREKGRSIDYAKATEEYRSQSTSTVIH